ncbi:hypothetical protein GLYMA_03G233200v4 [Glycine max]|uniref:Uncharacterized protein n=2 Tax=Glycine subgen. Soja TaxID=1462606 RepID=A0A0R0KT97_SOYBN|nr:hypothetical protein JHK85_008562 [Glycine max]KRH68466.1 hypothetical protein GLYMA_03G233200v4 [Glycine max]RZC22128.1 hypothetical protein D0Y65_008017 [Glycine soja]
MKPATKKEANITITVLRHHAHVSPSPSLAACLILKHRRTVPRIVPNQLLRGPQPSSHREEHGDDKFNE